MICHLDQTIDYITQLKEQYYRNKMKKNVKFHESKSIFFERNTEKLKD